MSHNDQQLNQGQDFNQYSSIENNNLQQRALDFSNQRNEILITEGNGQSQTDEEFNYTIRIDEMQKLQQSN